MAKKAVEAKVPHVAFGLGVQYNDLAQGSGCVARDRPVARANEGVARSNGNMDAAIKDAQEKLDA